MSRTKRVLSALLLVVVGIGTAILLIELGLRIIPESYWKTALSRNPWSHILFKKDEKVGWVHTPNARLQWQGSGEYDVDVQINSVGLRDYEQTYEKPPGTFRVLVLGDSFIEAMQVPVEQSFSTQLERCLAADGASQIEVLNGGVSGYGPGEELLYFTHHGVKFQPDLVLVAIYIGNDIRNMRHELGTSLLEITGGYKFYLENGRLKQQWVDWAEPGEEISGLERFLRRYSKLYYIFESPDSRVPHLVEDLTELWQPETGEAGDETTAGEEDVAAPENWPAYAYDPGLIMFARDFPDNPLVPPYMQELWELFKAPFLELKLQAETHNVTLATLIIPRGAQVHQEMYEAWVAKYTGKFSGLRKEDWDASAPNKATSAFLTGHGIPTLDLLPGFQAYAQAQDDPLYYPHDGHLNRQGHQVAAELACDWLKNNQLVPVHAPAAQSLDRN